MDDFVGKNEPVKYLTPFNIANLFRGDERGKKGLEAIGYDFGNNFVEHIIEGYRPILTRSGRHVFLGDEHEKGGIDGR